MATVNHVGQGMVNLPVTLESSFPEVGTMCGTVTSVDTQNDWIKVDWAGLPNLTQWYECEKFSTKMVDDKLTLVLILD